MSNFNKGKPYHGSELVSGGRLEGATGETDYFYFFCPKCPDREILRLLEYAETVRDEVNEYNSACKSKAMFGFTLAFKLYCENCGFSDFVKVTNTGLQCGKHSEVLRRA